MMGTELAVLILASGSVITSAIVVFKKNIRTMTCCCNCFSCNQSISPRNQQQQPNQPNNDINNDDNVQNAMSKMFDKIKDTFTPRKNNDPIVQSVKATQQTIQHLNNQSQANVFNSTPNIKKTRSF